MDSAFSRYGPIETLQTGDVLQRVVQEYDPSAAQTLTTTYADVDGSDYSFTPVSATSTIVYSYAYHGSADGTSDGLLFHTKLMVDGVEETESKTTAATTGVITSEFDFNYQYLIQSWGTTAKTIKMQAREFNSSYDAKLHETLYVDGAQSTSLVRAVLTITEYAT